MKETAESNLLKSKHYLQINKIDFHELHPGTHFRIFLQIIPFREKTRYIDLWPTTLKWKDSQVDKVNYGIESFIEYYKEMKILPIKEENKPQSIILSMTLHEYYIGQAIAGLCGRSFSVEQFGGEDQRTPFVEWASEMALEIANETIIKLNELKQIKK